MSEAAPGPAAQQPPPDPASQQAASGAAPQASDAAPPSAAAEGVPPEEAPKHLYDAVATQRDHVLSAFDTQKAAVLQAVAEQREAAIQPVRDVQARQAAQDGPAPAGLAGGGRIPPVAPRQQAVAADIVATLKVLIAEEVRAQLLALLDAASQRQAAVQASAQPSSTPAPNDRHAG